MKKYKCLKCGSEWFSIQPIEEEECPDSDIYENHKIKEVKRLSASDYVDMWESELENANRHSLTEMPSMILAVLSENISDKSVVKKIIKRLYDLEIGI